MLGRILPTGLTPRHAGTRRIAVTALAAALIAVSGAAHAATWRVTTLLSPENPISALLQDAAKQIEEKTEGRLKFQIAYGSESGLSARQYLDAVKMRLIDGAVIPTSGAATDYPWLGAYNVPFLAPDIALRRPMFEATQPMLDEFLDKNSIVPLAHPLHAPRWSVMYLAAPARNLAELKGRLIRTYDPNTIALTEGLGATPTALQKSEVYLGLQRKTIDGAITDIAAAKEESYVEVTKAVLQLNALFLPNIIGVNKTAFESLSAADKETVKAVFDALQEEYWQFVSPAGDDDSFKFVEENGLEVIKPDEAMVEAMLKVRDSRLQAIKETGEEGAKAVGLLQSVLNSQSK